MRDSDILAAVEQWFRQADPALLDHSDARPPRGQPARQANGITSELLQVAGFLTAFSGFYFRVHVVTDATHREELLVELWQASPDRAAYLVSRRA